MLFGLAILAAGILLWGMLMPSKHMMTVVQTVDANTGSPVDATVEFQSDEVRRVHFVKEPTPLNSIGWFGDRSVTATFHAEGYESQTVQLNGGLVVVAFELQPQTDE